MAIGGIISGIGSMFGAAAGYKGQKAANKTNIQLAREGREHDMNMWNAQNEYNTPAMQMQRMKEAGLNPNLVAGATTQAGNADAPKPAHVARVNNELAQMSQMNLAPMISLYQDGLVKKAQADNLRTQNEGIAQDNVTKALTNELLKDTLPYQKYFKMNQNERIVEEIHNLQQDGTRKSWDNQVRGKGIMQEMEQQQSNVMNSLQYAQQKTRALQLENALNADLKPLGMHSRDNLFGRLLVKNKNKIGSGIQSSFDGISSVEQMLGELIKNTWRTMTTRGPKK